jgi:hypothetical protein
MAREEPNLERMIPMEPNTNPETAPVDLVPLTILALELPETADELAARLAGEIIIADDLGRRSVPATVARELILAEARRRYNVAEAARKRQAGLEERLREIRAKNPVGRGVRVDLPEGTLPVTAMTSAADKQFEGGTYRPVPSHLDWAFGNEGGGALIGPTPGEVRRAAEARKQERLAQKARKGGSK